MLKQWETVIEEARTLCNGLIEYGRGVTYLVVEISSIHSGRLAFDGLLTVQHLEEGIEHDSFWNALRLVSIRDKRITRWEIVGPCRS